MKLRVYCVECNEEFQTRTINLDVVICPQCSAEYDVFIYRGQYGVKLIQKEPEAHEDTLKQSMTTPPEIETNEGAWDRWSYKRD